MGGYYFCEYCGDKFYFMDVEYGGTCVKCEEDVCDRCMVAGCDICYWGMCSYCTEYDAANQPIIKCDCKNIKK